MRLSDLVSLSQARRAAGFLPLSFALAGGAAVLTRLLGPFVLLAAVAAGIALQAEYPGDFGYRLRLGRAGGRDLVRAGRRRGRARRGRDLLPPPAVRASGRARRARRLRARAAGRGRRLPEVDRARAGLDAAASAGARLRAAQPRAGALGRLLRPGDELPRRRGARRSTSPRRRRPTSPTRRRTARTIASATPRGFLRSGDARDPAPLRSRVRRPRPAPHEDPPAPAGGLVGRSLRLVCWR